MCQQLPLAQKTPYQCLYLTISECVIGLISKSPIMKVGLAGFGLFAVIIRQVDARKAMAIERVIKKF